MSRMASYGVLSVWNSTTFTYEQRDRKGNLIDSYTYAPPTTSKEPKSGLVKQKIIAGVVLTCSLLFLCYFIYSWISCYMKKPRTEERERIGRGEEHPYAMQPISTTSV